MLSAFVPAAAGQTASVESLARAAGGAPLLRAAEAAERVVLGRFEAPAAVDASGWIAWLRIERELAPSEHAASGERIRVAWEELVTDRPPRFAAGERALVALEPLPGWSLWRRRIPDGNALAVAAAGQAFLRAPDPASLEGLAHWLAVPAADRESPAGAAVLAGLVADAESALSLAAIDRLGAFPGLASRLGDDALADLRRAVSDPKRPAELRLRIVALAARGRIESLRMALVPLTEAGPRIAAAAWGAIAAIDGGLDPETLRRLLTSSDPGTRRVAAAHGAGTPLEARIAELALEDPASEVRTAALLALVGPTRPQYLEIGFRALSDPIAEVRAAAAQAVGAHGAVVVPRLRDMAASRSGSEASGPLGALSFAGRDGHAALATLARTHPDPKTRQLARLFSGRPLEEP